MTLGGGQIKAGRGPLIGNAGEYFVMGELLRRSATAGLTPRGATAWDILTRCGDRDVRIRVKTRTAAASEVARDSGGWVWSARESDGVVFKELGGGDDWTILVALDEPPAQPRYWVLPTAKVLELITDRYAKWLAAPGKGGRKRNASTMRRLTEAEVTEYREAWDRLWGPPADSGKGEVEAARPGMQ